MILFELDPDTLKDIFLAEQNINGRALGKSNHGTEGLVGVFQLHTDRL